MQRNMFSFRENIVSWSLTSALIICLICSFVWKQRWLYYYGWKLPGPIALPIIRNFSILLTDPKNIIKTLKRLTAPYAPVVRIWLDTLYIVSTRPQDVETVLTRCLDKGEMYCLANDLFEDTVVFAPIAVWKKHRQILNELLKPRIINTFTSIFSREAKLLCNALEENKPVDVFFTAWKIGTNAACETIGGVKPNVLTGKTRSMLHVVRYEDLLVKRFFSIYLQSDFFWKLSSMKKEVDRIVERSFEFWEKLFCENRKVAEEMQSNNADGDDKMLFNKRLLTYLIDTKEENQFSRELILRQAGTLIPVASETSAVALSSVFLMLGMYQEIQDKVYEEQVAIFGTSDRDATMEDVPRMEYLERVIKETLRLLPPVPFLERKVDQDLVLDSCVLPKGSRFFVIVERLHRNPDFWPDPLKFDPDRFLPEIAETRPRGSYIPFSIGSRSCAGSKYAMLFLMIVLSTMLRRYKILKVLDYDKIEDIELTFFLVGKAINGYRVILERRNTSNSI